jgi:hypothetical protein
MTTVAVNTYTHSVTYVADNILKSLKDIVRLSGLDPSHLVNSWESTMRAMRAWLESQHLEQVTLEIYDPITDALVTKWDIDIAYAWSAGGDGNFWTDTEQLKYHIRKQGIAPSQAKYRLLLKTKPNEPKVEGWGDVYGRSTTGMVRQSLGSTVEHHGLGANTSYWRKVS